MSGYDNNSGVYEDYENPVEQSGGSLRKQYEQVLAEVANLRKELHDERHGKAIKTLLESKGIDPAVGELIGDANPEEWIVKYGNLFKGKAEPVAEPPTPEPEAEAQAELDAEQQQLQAVADAEGGSSPTRPDNDALTRMRAITSEKELEAFFARDGK